MSSTTVYSYPLDDKTQLAICSRSREGEEDVLFARFTQQPESGDNETCVKLSEKEMEQVRERLCSRFRNRMIYIGRVGGPRLIKVGREADQQRRKYFVLKVQTRKLRPHGYDTSTATVRFPHPELLLSALTQSLDFIRMRRVVAEAEEWEVTEAVAAEILDSMLQLLCVNVECDVCDGTGLSAACPGCGDVEIAHTPIPRAWADALSRFRDAQTFVDDVFRFVMSALQFKVYDTLNEVIDIDAATVDIVSRWMCAGSLESPFKGLDNTVNILFNACPRVIAFLNNKEHNVEQ